MNNSHSAFQEKIIKILIVEDNQLNQMAIVRLLSQKLPNAQFTIAINGQEGLNKYQTEEFHMILMDLQMPIMDGQQATILVRALEQERNIPPVPILAMSADISKKVMEDCLANGFNDYIIKPFNPNTLVDKIIQFLPKNL